MDTNFEARILLCASCNEEFVFTIEAQDYFAQKGLVDDPQMCKSCYTESKRVKRTQEPVAKPEVAVNGNRRMAQSAGKNIK